MNLESLISAVENIIQDSSYTSEDITDLINEAVSAVAKGVEVPGELGITSPLPDLYATADVTLTDSARSVSLPADYQRGLFNVYGTQHIPLMDSFARFIKRYPALETGDSVEACVVHGKSLFYHPAVSGTVNVSYYKKPDTLTTDSDEPTCIPDHLHRRLLVSFACREIFNRIEDGIEGQKINTSAYDTEFYEAVMALDRELGNDATPEYIPDEDDFIL